VSEASANHVLDAALAYQKTAALLAAVKLDIFTVIGAEMMTPDDIAFRIGASSRGLRILCDYLTVLGLLKKKNLSYGLTHAAEIFLNGSSPLAMGSIVDFLAAPEMFALFLDDPTSYVRRGGSRGLANVTSDNVASDNPLWARFAHAMAPLAAITAKRVAAYVAALSEPPYTVLDIAAGHGLYGIEVAKAIPDALITAIDWPEVLGILHLNAEAAGVSNQFRTLAGNAFDLEWGFDFDLIILANFMHHFDRSTCTSLLRKAKANLAIGGQALAVDFVPNEDRISPPLPVMFAFWMLASTPGGDAYTANDLDEMARDAGFRGATTQPLPPTQQTLIIFEK
jgi:2-polyprenyl-3-methyl-5-hydroxy-6-metoxy-1,4-benzoquinol methylase